MHISYKLICPTPRTHGTAQNILMNAEGPRTCCTSCESFLRSSCIDDVLMNSILAPIPIPAPIFPLYPDLGHGTVFLFISFLARDLMKGSWGES